jgi:NAD-dependent dihydropyrimidine dehydrogenase PreA subunit
MFLFNKNFGVEMSLRYIENVVTLKLDTEKCNGCRMCLNVCPHEVFAFQNKRAIIQDLNACMECGACAKNCPEGAITVQAGVGCAAAVITGKLKGTAPECGCSTATEKAGCC